MGGFAFSPHGDILAKPEPVLARPPYLYRYSTKVRFHNSSRRALRTGLRLVKLRYLSENISHENVEKDGRGLDLAPNVDEPPERRVGGVSALSRAVEGRPARGDAHLAAPMTPPTDE